jgi:hypothetical protein
VLSIAASLFFGCNGDGSSTAEPTAVAQYAVALATVNAAQASRNQAIDRTPVTASSDESFVQFLEEFMNSFRIYQRDLVALSPPEELKGTRDEMVLAIDDLLAADTLLRDHIEQGDQTDEDSQTRASLFDASQTAFIEVLRLCRVMEQDTDRIDGLSCPWIVEAGQPPP